MSLYLNLGLMTNVGASAPSVPQSLYWNPEMVGGSDIVDGVGDIPDDHVWGNNTTSIAATFLGEAANPSYIFNADNVFGRAAYRQTRSSVEAADDLIVGNRYSFNAEVYLDDYDDAEGTDPLRGINIDNNAALVINRDNADHSGVTGWEYVEVIMDVIGESATIFLAHGHGVINNSSCEQRTRNIMLDDLGETPVLRKLLDSSGEVLTTESGEPLQHGLTSEDDMLFTDYMPNRSATTPLVPDIDDDTFVDVIAFSETLIAGTYEFIVSFVVSNPDTNDSLFWQVLGDTPSPEFREESKDTTDQEPEVFAFQYDHAGGVMEHTLQMRKEDNFASDITILNAGIYVKRVA